ncbi:hypothetical protein CWI36_0015p0040 [Hamiltosporidium magnivora]|uniref:Uncharacterized protein n=1 Tax=Hamiltosporidium magnivora TaxID=148818 RepID=A0A4Q9LML8_9MICR|nr:hypothetical protein CWI36_0015p0040 [Hamiltosporidium magnivora]
MKIFMSKRSGFLFFICFISTTIDEFHSYYNTADTELSEIQPSNFGFNASQVFTVDYYFQNSDFIPNFASHQSFQSASGVLSHFTEENLSNSYNVFVLIQNQDMKNHYSPQEPTEEKVTKSTNEKQQNYIPDKSVFRNQYSGTSGILCQNPDYLQNENGLSSTINIGNRVDGDSVRLFQEQFDTSKVDPHSIPNDIRLLNNLNAAKPNNNYLEQLENKICGIENIFLEKECTNYSHYLDMIPALYSEIDNRLRIGIADESMEYGNSLTYDTYLFRIETEISKYDLDNIKTKKTLNEILIFAKNLIYFETSYSSSIEMHQFTENMNAIMIKIENIGIKEYIMNFLNLWVVIEKIYVFM